MARRTLRSIPNALAASLLLALALSASSCGYKLVGAGALPPSVRTVAVLPFQRQVPVLQLDQRVTEAVTREVAQRMRVRVQSSKDGADAVLQGTITGYGVAPLAYDAAGRADRYQITMTAKITFTTAAGEVLFDSPSYRFTQNYARSGSPQSYVNQEVVAFEAVSRDFARALVASVLEGDAHGP